MSAEQRETTASPYLLGKLDDQERQAFEKQLSELLDGNGSRSNFFLKIRPLLKTVSTVLDEENAEELLKHLSLIDPEAKGKDLLSDLMRQEICSPLLQPREQKLSQELQEESHKPSLSGLILEAPTNSEETRQKAERLKTHIEQGRAREIHLDPPYNIYIDPAWLAWNEGMVKRLAQGAVETKHSTNFLVLADALGDAECDNIDIFRILRSEDPQDLWRAITIACTLIDQNPPLSALRESLTARRGAFGHEQPTIEIDSYANSMIDTQLAKITPPNVTPKQSAAFKWAAEEKQEPAHHDYVAMTVADLFPDGFPLNSQTHQPQNGATAQQIIEQAQKKYGLNPLTSRDVLSFRRRDTGEEWLLAGEPIPVSVGDRHVFRLNRYSDGSRLHAHWHYSGDVFDPRNHWVFSRGK